MKKQPIILINIYYSESGYGDRLIFPPNLYMNEFKKYQDIPLFNAKNMMSVEERIRELRIA